MKDTSLRTQRDKDFYQCYCTALDEKIFNNMHEAVEWCRLQPAPRYYISPKSLVNYMSIVRLGGSLSSLHYNNRRKVYDLMDRYREYKATHDTTGMSAEKICEIIVDQPAPRFYIGHDHALSILQKERQRRLRQ